MNIKAWLIAALAVTACLSVYAAPEVLPVAEVSNINTTTVAKTSTVDMQAVSAYVKGLVVYMTPSASTATVSVATSRDTIYSASVSSGTISVYPVAEQSTNGTAAGWFAPYYLANDKITVSAHSANKTGVTVQVTAIVDRQR